MASYVHHSNSRCFSKEAEAKATRCYERLCDWNSAVQEIRSWPEYEPQPLRSLDNYAKTIGIGNLYYKDESLRFGRQIASFKALGAPYTISQLLADYIQAMIGVRPTSAELRAGKHKHLTARFTVCVATDGNQGRGLAYGAKIFRCRCVNYIHNHVSPGRKQAMEELGAVVIRINGDYQASVDRAKEDARMNEWVFVSSTSWDDFASEVPRNVMNGYMVLVEEAYSMVPDAHNITHIIMCGGVGSIAAAVFLGFQKSWEEFRKVSSATSALRSPRFIVLEPKEADCLLQSSVEGRPAPATGSLRTSMAGLACREPSPAAMKLLDWLASDFVAVPDSVAEDGMKALASGGISDIPIVCGESSGASMGLMLLVKEDRELREKLGMDQSSRVLLFGCEGATDATIYERIVGKSADAIFEAQARHLNHDSL